MATTNQIELRKLREAERSNRVNERIKQYEADIKADTLAETISNNLRNYKINVDKNDIQRLANDQLDARESQKILATIQDNLANQSLKLQQNLETERNNKRKNELEEELNGIKRMDTLLNAAKATGKTPTAILLSWFTNQANLQAFAGTNNASEYYKQVKSWLENGDSSLSSQKKSQSKFDRSGVYEEYNPRTNEWSKNEFVTEWTDRSGQRHQGEPNYTDKLTNKVKSVRKGYRYKEKLPGDIKYHDSNVRGSREDKKLETRNEIPNDYSNSYGPGIYNTPQNAIVIPSISGGPGVNSGESRPTSGGTDYNLSTGHISSGVIYAPKG